MNKKNKREWWKWENVVKLKLEKKKSDIRVPISIHKSLNLTIFCPIITLMEDILD